MNYEFYVFPMQTEEHLFWIAESKVLKGCVGQGETAGEAIEELSLNETEWLETAAQCQIPIPPKTAKKPGAYSGRVSLRFSPFVHEQASEAAKEQGISLNQYLNDAIVYYNALTTQSRPAFLGEQAAALEGHEGIIRLANLMEKKRN